MTTVLKFFVYYKILVHEALWKIQDALVRIKKIILEAVDLWNCRLSEVARKSDKKKEKQQSEADSPRTPDMHEVNPMQTGESGNSPALARKIRSLDQCDGKYLVFR